ncbi:uncharacterized protein [Haliotis asinina]|uniref:uncharacterized protein n=1 Tax=Haliotis asinina TaxID=109174 RepID=UPI0035327646
MSKLLITLSFLLLMAVAAFSTKPALNRAKKTSDPNQWKNRPQSPCHYGGRVYQSGAVFLAQNRCSTIRCMGGQMQFASIKCLYNNMCYNVGANIRGGHNGCQLMNCQGNGQFRPVLSDPYRCKDAYNMCRICQG